MPDIRDLLVAELYARGIPSDGVHGFEPGRWYPLPGPGKRPGNTATRVKLEHGRYGDLIAHVKVWSTGESFTVTPGRTPHKPPLQRTVRESESHRQRQTAKARAHAAAVARIRDQWEQATPATAHPYTDCKQVRPHPCRIDQNGTLLVPRIDFDGKLRALQRIDEAGAKRYSAGTPTAGTFCLIGTAGGGLYLVCEGFATGATLHEHTRLPVLCAMDCGNLQAVSIGLRKQAPRATIIIAADDDRCTSGNPGQSKANAAAIAADARLLIPALCDGCTCTDWNDAVSGPERGADCVMQHRNIERLQAVAAHASGQE